MNFIQSRLLAIELFPFFYESIKLDDEFAKNTINMLNRKLLAQTPLKVVDISSMDTEVVKQMLLAINVPNSDVYVLWFGDNIGIKIPFHIFCNFYDDLWYPSSDDILVCDTKKIFIIEVSHEESVSFWKLD